MNFKDFVVKSDADSEKIRGFLKVQRSENVLKIDEILKKYPDLSKSGFLSFFTTVFPFNLIFADRVVVDAIGDETYFVREPDFAKAFSAVSKYFKNTKGKNIKWRGVYKEGILGDEVTLQRVGYKFFVDENFTDDAELPVTEQDYVPVEISDYVVSRVRDGHPEIKLISILNEDRMITKHMILHSAEKMGCIDVPDETLEQILNNPNTWVTLKASKSGKNWRLQLRIVDMNCKVFLTLINPGTGTPPPSVDEIVERLKMRGIIFGIKKDAIKRYIASGRFDEECLAVEGKIPVDGKEEVIDEVAFKKLDKRPNRFKKKLENEDIFSKFVTVSKQELVFKRIPGTKGTDGIDVFGRTLEAKIGSKEVEKLKIGNNLSFSKDRLEVYANIGGNLFCNKDGVWNIEKVLKLESVNSETGNISHIGSVLIENSVDDGFSLMATGNVRVGKSVGAAKIEAGGDIDIILGMNGKGKGKLISHFGSIGAKFILDATVIADKKVAVQELLGNCRVHSGGVVEAVGVRSAIWGGDVRAYLEIMAMNIGSVAERKTIVGVGIPQSIRLRMEKVINTLAELRKKYVDMKERSRPISEERETPKGSPMYEKELSELRNKISEAETERKELEIEEDLEDTPARIVVTGTMYGGVTIYCNKAMLMNRKYRKMVVMRQNLSHPELVRIEPYIHDRSSRFSKK